jgi:hypothetical protein
LLGPAGVSKHAVEALKLCGCTWQLSKSTRPNTLNAPRHGSETGKSKIWFDEESDEIYDFGSDDERLRCPGCVMKGFRITVSKSFVQRRNRERENREWLKEIAEKEKKDEEDKLAADAKAKDIAIRKAAQTAYKDGSVTEGLKRKGDMKAEGCASKAKRQKESAGASALAVNEQRTILSPKRPHLFDALCGCARCDAELEELSKKPVGMFDMACARHNVMETVSAVQLC